MKITKYILPSLALGAAAILFAPPEDVLGYSTIGGSLSAETQRDYRVWNNFADSAANNNTTVDPNWPGWDGADVALWKATAEWGSEAFGDGSGDPLQATVGDGGANFDAYFAGGATGNGNSNYNIISAGTSCPGGVIAYVESPISNGWRMIFCDNAFIFSDGPGSSGYVYMDIQGIGTHEFGHSLGLGHSTSSGATMWSGSTANGSNDLRSIEADDKAGVQFIYGVKSATKPVITGVSFVGDVVTITGANFSTTNNEVRFTRDLATPGNIEPHLRVTGVSSTGGGTQIVVTKHADSGPGVVMVKKNATGHASLSNAYPIDLPATPDPDPVADFSASPLSGDAPLFVAFTNLSTGTGPFTYAWDFGDTGTSTSTSPGYFYTVPGTYTVTMTVTGALGVDTMVKTDYITVGGTIYANATVRNGTGANPNIFTSTSMPVLGTDWTSEVDAGALGVGGFVFNFVYAGGITGVPTAFGELLLDPATPWLYTDLAIAVGGTASHSIAIPNDSAYVGAQASCQAYLNSVAPSGQLTNAIDLLMGY